MVRRWAGCELKFTDRAEEAEDRGCCALLRRRRARSEDKLELVRLSAGREGNGTLEDEALLTELHSAGRSLEEDCEAIEEGVGRP